MEREVGYARNADTHIAYELSGHGRPLLFVQGFVSHLDIAWEEPSFAQFLRALARFSRLIRFDKRGCGLSDPVTELPTTAERLDDIIAVLDAAGVERTTLLGISEGASTAAVFALQHPERVTSLILYSGVARLLRTTDFPYGWSEEGFEGFLDRLEKGWAGGFSFDRVNPSLVGDERYEAWYSRYVRAAASPAMARAVMQACAATDLRQDLGRIRVPTLILHRTDERWVPVEHGRYLADHIPGAKLVELPGVDHWPWVGNADAVLREIEAFVTGVRPSRKHRPAWGPDALTRREREVARLLVDGYSAREIGEKLFISERTAESHIANAYLKLGVGTRVDLTRRASEFGIV